MNLKTYLKTNSQTELAKALGVTQGAVWQWARGLTAVAIERCTAIERATKGQVTRRDLRPNDWHLIWPELVTNSHPAPVAPDQAAVEKVAQPSALDLEHSEQERRDRERRDNERRESRRRDQERRARD